MVPGLVWAEATAPTNTLTVRDAAGNLKQLQNIDLGATGQAIIAKPSDSTASQPIHFAANLPLVVDLALQEAGRLNSAGVGEVRWAWTSSR